MKKRAASFGVVHIPGSTEKVNSCTQAANFCSVCTTVDEPLNPVYWSNYSAGTAKSQKPAVWLQQIRKTHPLLT
jgi:hypothetical protein